MYVGITVGPIIQTMSYASAPGALWFASYFFSTITKCLCDEIGEENILTLRKKDGDSDFYQEKYDAGIGIYHDRIYCKLSGKNKTDVNEKIKTALEKMYKSLASSIEGGDIKSNDMVSFLEQYLSIHYVILTEKEIDMSKGIAKTLADYLDALELSQQISFSQSNNIIRKIMQGDKKRGNNVYLESIPLFTKFSETVPGIAYLDNGKTKIKTLLNIASGGKCSDESESGYNELAKQDLYYAIVYADGDNMGDLITDSSLLLVEQEDTDSSLLLVKQEEKISNFSTLCTEYSDDATKKVEAYGGVTIYAGGDDLLFLAPIFSSKEDSEIKNIWRLCDSIASGFGKRSEHQASISFGVSINYYKYPLYEALEDARGLLFSRAKEFSRKNNIATKIHKASGQTQGFICCLESGKTVERIIESYLTLVEQIYGANQKEDTNQLLHSVLYHMESKASLFNKALENSEGTEIRCLMKNCFGFKTEWEEGKERPRIQEQLEAIWVVLMQIINLDNRAVALSDEEVPTDIELATNMLRMAKFLVEVRDNE